jgi:8-oxo-dGTP diphosphatase
MTDYLEVQRVAAYGLVVVDDEVLLTRLSEVTSAPGQWTLPGGGVDPGEHPRDAVVRELHEETGLSGRAVALLGVDSFSTVRALADDVTERYHAIRVLYRVEVEASGPLRVLDVGGSTDEARWHRVGDLLGDAAGDEAATGAVLVPTARWALQLLGEPGTPV